jgi:hypothetical protein
MRKADFNFQRKFQVPNPKLQIHTNNQNPMIKTQPARVHLKIGIWYLFVIWCLKFGASNRVS